MAKIELSRKQLILKMFKRSDTMLTCSYITKTIIAISKNLKTM